MRKVVATLLYVVGGFLLLMAGTLASMNFGGISHEDATESSGFFFAAFVFGSFVAGTGALLGGAYAAPSRAWKRASGGVLLGVAGYSLFVMLTLLATFNDPAMASSQRAAAQTMAREEGISEADAQARVRSFFDGFGSAANLVNGLVAVAGMSVMGVALLRRYRPPRAG